MKPPETRKSRTPLIFLIVMLAVFAGWLWYTQSNISTGSSRAGELTRPDEPIAAGQRLDRGVELRHRLEQNNVDNQEHMKAFTDDGWKVVASSSHDPEVVKLNPDLLTDKEHDLRRQLETTRVSEELLGNALEIALQADEHRTRAAAINAIGHSSSSRRNNLLIELVEQLTDERERGQALGFIRPTGIDTAGSQWLIAQLSSDAFPERLKEQIPTKLVLTGLHENGGNEGFIKELLDAVPLQWRDAVMSSLKIHNGSR